MCLSWSDSCVHSGYSYNVIADKAEIKGTVRSFNPDVRKKLEERIRTVSAGACQHLPVMWF